jgi:hypothetical protein
MSFLTFLTSSTHIGVTNNTKGIRSPSNNKFVLLCNICITGSGMEQLPAHSKILLYKPGESCYSSVCLWRKDETV